ncbi:MULTISPECIES: serine/threonine-protein kinase [unclassified Nodularia (in: cyanobacteria)]|uniref:serine/threonine-protein kinase n=1 Tax=unclassified Nodularia (in: cyanobacteria) TaxID=2656917 RepID=UPI001D14D3A3|nr:serine/threonine-protein kinase [Nodularia sp. LEGE 06071]
MKLCPNVSCLYSQNPDTANFCIKCGGKLLLQDRYHLLRCIGQGGFGKTYLAVDEHLPSKLRCVIKQLCFQESNRESCDKAVELFRQEAVSLNELQHPQIPKLLGYFEQKHQLYLVQELILGQTLEQELQAQGVKNESQIGELLQNLLPVLQFIHDRKVIHRDIKPANIMRRLPQGDLVLIDFGVAKHVTTTALLQTGTTIGSPEYIAPEQTRGKALPASDLYSLGVTCIYLLTGIPPFDLFDVMSDRWVWRDYILSENRVSHALGQILDKLLHNALSERYQSAGEVLQALNVATLQLGNSQVELDYSRLRDLLAFHKWKQADQETWVLMCEALSKPIGSYLFCSDLKNLPDETLQIIDQLWLKYSKGHFGFSVQKQIYESVDGDYGKFCAAIGWSVHNSSFSPQVFLSWSVPKG